MWLRIRVLVRVRVIGIGTIMATMIRMVAMIVVGWRVAVRGRPPSRKSFSRAQPQHR